MATPAAPPPPEPLAPAHEDAPPTQHDMALSEYREAPTQHETEDERTRLPDTYFHGSLFKDDNTGTDKYRNLMRGLKDIIIRRYEPTESTDLMPGQLVKYYEDLNGDYSELFNKTPSPSIAFIYKSLGCSYSLQPVPHAERVEEPEVPALKTEGWIMWSTIQMLLGPDEHAGFLMEAVKRWDITDPETGKLFPKVLPRDCLPATPDKRMSDWYEGVSRRLTQEAEEEAKERQRVLEHAETRRISSRNDDTDSVDSRGPALAYFRNPLYRHVDGRPSIVRRGSIRPELSPRRSFVDKGKAPAITIGDERDRRRRSVSDNRYHHPSEPAPPGVPPGDRLPGPGQQISPQQRRDQRRTGSISGESDSRGSAHGSTTHLRPHDREHALRHSRSHDPSPSQREQDDYFQQNDAPPRRGEPPEDMPPSIGPSFAPSPGLPFAAAVARQQPPPQSEPGRPQRPGSSRGDRRPPSPERRDRYDDPAGDGSRRRSRSRYDDRPPYDDRARFDDKPPRSRSRLDDRPPPDDRPRFEDKPPRPRSRLDDRPPNDRQRFDDRAPPDRQRFDDRPPPDRQRFDDRPPPDRRFDDRPPHDGRHRHSRPPPDERPRRDRLPYDERPRHDDRRDPDDRARHHDDRRGPDDRPRFDDRGPPEERPRFDERREPDDRRYDDRGPPPNDRRFDDRGPPPDDRRLDERGPPDDRRRYDDRREPDDRPRHDDRREPDDRQRYDDRREPDDRSRYDDRVPPPEDRRRPDDRYEGPPDPRRLSGQGHLRSASRRSRGSDIDAYSGAEDDRQSNRKQTRFAAEPIAGVSGRAYVDQSPWQG